MQIKDIMAAAPAAPAAMVRTHYGRAGLVMLEVSVVVFLLQGYLTSGREVSYSRVLHPHSASST